MRIVGHVVIRPIGGHSMRAQLSHNEVPDQLYVLFCGQLHRQRQHKLAHQLRVAPGLIGLNCVPEECACFSSCMGLGKVGNPGRRILRQRKFRMRIPALARVIDLFGRLFPLHLCAMPIGGRGHGGPPCPLADDLR
nr:hypothetical protein [Labrenzia sp. DG1229]